MATPLLPSNRTGAEEDEKNVGQSHYDDQVSNSASNSYASAGLDQLESFANDPENATGDSVKDSESNPQGNSPWKTDIGEGNDLNKPKWEAAIGFAKKKKGILGLVGIFGVSGGLLAGFFGPSSMIINLMENFTSVNDSSSSSLERRALKIFRNVGTDTSTLCSSSKIKCKMGKLSNSAVKRLASKGVIPLDETGKPMDTSKRTGYPDKNPSQYKIDGVDKPIPASELVDHLVNNPKSASKVLGIKGAFNLKRSAWVGKYITKKFYDKFGIKRSGGIADGKSIVPGDSSDPDNDTHKSALSKLRERIPGIEKLDNATSKIRTKVGSHLGKAKKGGAAYMTLVASCIAVKAPAYIAGAVAAVQLAQLLPIVNDVILSPGSKAKASVGGSGFSGNDANAVGTILTNKTARPSDGKMTSALDSPIFLQAMGVNKGSPGVSKKYTPGYSVLTNDVVVKSRIADKATESECNAIMSPAAMYSAMAVDAAVTVAASATIIGGVIKVAASLIVSEVVSQVAQQVAGDIAEDVIKDVAANDDIPKAEGEELGDVLGTSGIAFFGSGAMARHVPALTVSQLAGSDLVKAENEDFNKQMAIASLSPFDVSSKYTFLGSIIHNTSLSMISSGSYNDSALSIISNIARIPSFVASTQNVGAAESSSVARCSYADDFMLDNTNNPDLTPAISIAGTPCTGLTPTQASMSTSTAMDLISNEGWFDESVTINDSDSIEDLTESGYIKGGTPLKDYIDTCSDASSGDYLFNAASCASQDTVKNTQNLLSTVKQCGTELNGDGVPIQVCATEVVDDTSSEPSNGTTGVSSQDALLAIPVFLLDYQLIQSVNGEDEDDFSEPAQTSDVNFDELYLDSSSQPCDPRTTDAGVADGYHDGVLVKIKLCGISELNNSKVNARVSTNIMDMLEGMSTAGVNIGATSSFRTQEEQRKLFENGSNPAAKPGFSNHQMGLALDFKFYDESGGGISNNAADCSFVDSVCQPPKPSAAYTWLVNNATKYGYSQLKTEFWHWEVKKV